MPPLRALAASTTIHGVCAEFRRRGHNEQGCLEHLLKTNSSVLPDGVLSGEKLQPARLQAFNSPWGRHIRHFWNGVGKELRTPRVEEELRVQGIWSVTEQMSLVDSAVRQSVPFSC